jgi:hypothetical protein
VELQVDDDPVAGSRATHTAIATNVSRLAL